MNGDVPRTSKLSRQVKDLSPKVGAASLGTATATIVWIVVAAFTDTFTEEQITALTGASAVILGFIAGYLIRDPVRAAVKEADEQR